MARTIDLDELKGMMDRGERFILINVLDEKSYKYEHICASINIPVDRIDTEAPEKLRTDETVVVHCSGPTCKASGIAARKLEELGYNNVWRFEGGIEEWKKADYCLEGGAYAGVRVA